MSISPRLEKILYVMLFIISCLHSSLIYVYLIVVFLGIRKGSEWFIKMCVLFTVRQIFYLPGVAVSINSAQINFKLALYTVAAIIELFRGIEYRRESIWILVFGFFAGFSALVFGSYPFSGIIKVISFSLVFFAICIATQRIKDRFSVLDYVYNVFSVFMMVSFFLIPFTDLTFLVGSSGLLFRGIWNHPNDFGVGCSIFLAIILVRAGSLTIKDIIFIICTIVMIFLSGSRGALISASLVLIFYLFLAETPKNRRIIGAMLGIGVLLVLTIPSFRDSVFVFFNKGGGDSINNQSKFGSFMSREQIFDTAVWRFSSSPLFGRGLLITYTPGVKDFSLLDKGYEPGTIFLELLAGTGIIGSIVFFVMLFMFIRGSSGKYRLLVLTAVFASISEVSFFSVNNYAVIYYILIACSTLHTKSEESNKKVVTTDIQKTLVHNKSVL